MMQRRRISAMVCAGSMVGLALYVGLTCLAGFAETCRNILDSIAPGILAGGWVSYQTYYAIGGLLLLIICVFLAYALYKAIARKPVVHDLQYMQNMLRSQNSRTAIVSVNDAVLRTLDASTGNFKQEEVRQLLRRNYEPIRKFLASDIGGQDVLVVSAPWGDGKTSNVLMAADSLDSDIQERRRYIYGSVFKYTNGVREFNRGILKELEDVLLEWGIESRNGFAALINNIGPEIPQTLAAMIGAVTNPAEMLIAEELIHEINDRYMRRFKTVMAADWPQLIIIIDDLDRAVGEDIIQVLSLLSILRRFSFVKIVVPVELKAVIKQLERLQIYKPEDYLNKYLPEQCAVKLRSQFQIVEEILLRQIRLRSMGRGKAIKGFRPALAAILMKCLIDILERDSENWSGKVNWNLAPSVKPFYMEWSAPDGANKVTDLILDQVAQDMSDTLDEGAAQGKYAPDPEGLERMANLAQIFDNIVYCSTNKPISENFTDEAYRDAVEGWIFSFMEENWNELGITLRDLEDLLIACNLSNLEQKPGAQFCQVYNRLLKSEKLQYEKAERKS